MFEEFREKFDAKPGAVGNIFMIAMMLFGFAIICFFNENILVQGIGVFIMIAAIVFRLVAPRREAINPEDRYKLSKKK